MSVINYVVGAIKAISIESIIIEILGECHNHAYLINWCEPVTICVQYIRESKCAPF